MKKGESAVVTFPENTDVTYLGRNRHGKQTGAKLHIFSEGSEGYGVWLTPMNTKGEAGSCRLAFPQDEATLMAVGRMFIAAARAVGGKTAKQQIAAEPLCECGADRHWPDNLTRIYFDRDGAFIKAAYGKISKGYVGFVPSKQADVPENGVDYLDTCTACGGGVLLLTF